jgi:hypothetical protein
MLITRSGFILEKLKKNALTILADFLIEVDLQYNYLIHIYLLRNNYTKYLILSK